jgi:hypothetical protein
MSISYLYAASINQANHVRVRRLNAMRCGETFSIGQAVSKEVRRSSITLRRDGLDAITIRDQLPLKSRTGFKKMRQPRQYPRRKRRAVSGR